MNIGQRIRSQREKLGLTQEELAKKLGYKSRSSVNKVETSRELSNKKVLQYAEALDCSPAYLMGWEEIDSHFSGHEASDEVYRKFTQNIEKHHGKEKELIDIYRQLSDENKNKTIQYSKGLLSVQQMDTELQLDAAHARTDTEITEEMKKHDDDIMDDENF